MTWRIRVWARTAQRDVDLTRTVPGDLAVEAVLADALRGLAPDDPDEVQIRVLTEKDSL
jgi:hypothetical protein